MKYKSRLKIKFRDYGSQAKLIQGSPWKTQPMIQKVYYKQRKRNKTLYVL